MQEAEKFKNAFDDPEFCKLMAEYVAELQDPSNRAVFIFLCFLSRPSGN